MTPAGARSGSPPRSPTDPPPRALLAAEPPSIEGPVPGRTDATPAHRFGNHDPIRIGELVMTFTEPAELGAVVIGLSTRNADEEPDRPVMPSNVGMRLVNMICWRRLSRVSGRLARPIHAR